MIALLIEIPEEIHEAVQTFLRDRPEWDGDRLASASFSLFLLQNAAGTNQHQRQVARTYLDTLFKPAA